MAKPALGGSYDLMNLLPGGQAVPAPAAPAAEPKLPAAAPARSPEAPRERRRRAVATRPVPPPAPPVEPEPEPAVRVVLERVPAQVPAPLLEEARREVYWTPGLTLSALVAEALEEHLARLKAARKRSGEEENLPPLPRGRRIRTGRPLGGGS
jgi:hypothetical protein